MGWATTPIYTGLFMETIKLERNGKVVVRSKAIMKSIKKILI
jgi:hypothetical protein